MPQKTSHLDVARAGKAPREYNPAREKRGLIVLLVLCVISAVVSRFGFLNYPFYNDSGLYIYMGKIVADGGHLYHDYFETKFPGVAMIAAMCWRLFGTHFSMYILMQTVMSLAAAILLGRTVARRVGEFALWPTALAGIVYFNLAPAVFGGFQLETIQLFFAVVAACAAIEMLCGGGLAFAFLAGLGAGSAAMIKPSGLSVVGAIVIAWFYARTRGAPAPLKMFGSLAAGVLLPVAAVFLWTFREGLLDDMPEVFRQVRLYASETPILTVDWLKLVLILAAMLLPPIVRYTIWRRDAIELDPAGAARRLALWAFAIAWFVLEFSGAILQRRMYLYHFMPIAPPAAMIFGMLPRKPRAMPIFASLWLLALGSLIYIGPDFAAVARRGVPRHAVSDYLLQHTKSDDSIYFDQYPRILLETGLKPGARYPHLFYMANYDEAPFDVATNLLSDFEDRQPRYIILRADIDQRRMSMLEERPQRLANYRAAWGQIRAYIDKKYDAETEVDGDGTRWVMYRRKNR